MVKPKYRNRRIGLVIVFALIAALGVSLLLKALGDNKELFKNPHDVVAADFVQPPQAIRVGGLVVEGSVQKRDGLKVRFQVVDFENPDPDIPPLSIVYEGVLPDLFAEGQGVVVTGRLNTDHVFVAKTVLAKHDENYMPKMPS